MVEKITKRKLDGKNSKINKASAKTCGETSPGIKNKDRKMSGKIVVVGVNYFCRLTTIRIAGSPLSFFGRSCCRDCVAGLLRCGSWAH